MTDRPLVVVGQITPMHDDPSMPLYPLPRGSTGERTYRLAVAAWMDRRGILTPDLWLGITWRFNLCRGTFSPAQAEAYATEINDMIGDRPMLLLGNRVARAFLGVEASDPACMPGYGWTLASAERDGAYVIPYPHGSNRAWDAPGTLPKAIATVSRWLTAGGYPTLSAPDAGAALPVHSTPARQGTR